MDIQLLIKQGMDCIVNSSFIYVITIGAICTVMLKFIQVRYFGYAWKSIFKPSKPAAADVKSGKVDMTPLQAFINTLSTNLGNGSLAGTATAIYSGGPGAAFWIIIFGMLLMAARFAEVFLSIYYGARQGSAKKALGGPMLYLQDVPFGSVLASSYAFLCLWYGLLGGCGIQSNSIRVSLHTTFGISPYICAFGMLLFILYVVYGGAQRIVKASDAIVPLKVILFFSSALLVLGYHWQALWSSMVLIVQSALTPSAVAGGALGFTVQQAMRFGMMRSIFSTESGVGSAGILFGFTGSHTAVKDSIMSMLSTFISTIVCFIVALCIIASGVWNSGLTSTALTIAAFKTVFGTTGAYVVTFLSVTFGIGVAVSYAYIGRECWLFLTGGRYAMLFPVIYCFFAFTGALISPDNFFAAADIVQAFMLFINLFGIMYLLPVIIRSVNAFAQQEQ